jgi:hypothetical protein
MPFVRDAFYLPPPARNSPASVWATWLKADRALAIQAKRRHTMSLKAEPENAVRLWSHGSGIPIAGKDGVHRQSTGFIGFESRGAEGGADVVAAVQATQDRYHSPRGTDGTEQTTAKLRASRRKVNKATKRRRLWK